MANLLYVGQTAFAKITTSKKTLQGTVVITAKELDEHGKIQYTVLAMDGVTYLRLHNEAIFPLSTKEKKKSPIMHGIACSFKFGASSLPKQYLKTNNEKLLKHLKEAWELLNKGTLICEAFVVEKPAEKEAEVSPAP